MSWHPREPAFPNTGNSTWNLEPCGGMTLRTYLAAQALPATLAESFAMARTGTIPLHRVYAGAADGALAAADALLAELAKDAGK